MYKELFDNIRITKISEEMYEAIVGNTEIIERVRVKLNSDLFTESLVSEMNDEVLLNAIVKRLIANKFIKVFGDIQDTTVVIKYSLLDFNERCYVSKGITSGVSELIVG